METERYTPLGRVPDDIWLRIFVQSIHGFCIGTTRCCRKAPTPCSNPFYLSAVCQEWRDLALSSSKLWFILDIHFDRDSRTNERHTKDDLRARCRKQCELVEIAISRAGDRALTVAIQLDENVLDPSNEIALRVARIIAKHAHKMGKLSTPLYPAWFRILQEGQFKALELVDLRVPGWPRAQSVLTAGQYLGGTLDLTSCTELKRVQLHGGLALNDGVALSWKNVVEARFLGLPLERFAGVLEQVGHCEHLNLSGHYQNLPSPEAVAQSLPDLFALYQKQVTLHLRKLSLGLIPLSAVERILSLVHDGLEGLSIYGTHPYARHEMDFIPLVRKLPRFASTLSDFTLECFSPKWIPLEEILHSLPRLTCIHLSGDFFDETLIHRCFVTDGLLPTLQSLTLRIFEQHNKPIRVRLEHILDILEYRRCSLKTAEIHLFWPNLSNHDKGSLDVRPTLLEMAEEGRKITVVMSRVYGGPSFDLLKHNESDWERLVSG